MSQPSTHLESGSPKRPLAIIFCTVLLTTTGFGILFPVLPLFAKQYQATEFECGALVGVYSLLQFLVSPWYGRISDRVGRRPVLLWSVLFTAVGFLIMGSAQNFWMLFIGRIIEGLSGGNLGTAQAAIADVTTREERSRSMGLIGAAFGMGFVLGPAIGAIAAAVFDSKSAPLYVSAGLALLNALFIAVCLPETFTPERRKEAREEPTGTLLRGGDGADRRILLGVYFLGIAGFSVMTGVFSLYVENRHGFDVPKVGGLFAFIGVVGVLVQGGLVRRLLKRPIEKRTALAGSVVVAGSLLALPAVPDPVWLYVACAGLALGNGLFNPSLSGLASRLASATSQGRFLGMMQSAGSLGRFMGPIIGGGLLSKNPAGSYTPVAFWAAAGISLAAAGLLAGMRATDGSREPSKTGAAS